MPSWGHCANSQTSRGAVPKLGSNQPADRSERLSTVSEHFSELSDGFLGLSLCHTTLSQLQLLMQFGQALLGVAKDTDPAELRLRSKARWPSTCSLKCEEIWCQGSMTSSYWVAMNSTVVRRLCQKQSTLCSKVEVLCAEVRADAGPVELAQAEMVSTRFGWSGRWECLFKSEKTEEETFFGFFKIGNWQLKRLLSWRLPRFKTIEIRYR